MSDAFTRDGSGQGPVDFDRLTSRVLEERYGDHMPHRVLESALGALRVPAMLVADDPAMEILSANDLVRKEVSYDFNMGASLTAIIREKRAQWLPSALNAVRNGDDIAVHGGDELTSYFTWRVVSRMPDVDGWPPCLMITVHREPRDEMGARVHHQRDRLAIECAILLDRARVDAAMQADMARASYMNIEQMSKRWVDRLCDVEAALLND